MKLIIYISFFFVCGISQAQVVLDRVLIGSGYSEFGSGDFNLSASVGEPIISTQENGSLLLTQGFQQSNYVLSLPFIVDLEANDAACLGANDGSVTVSFTSDNLIEPLSYSWSNGSITKDLTQLEVGLYQLTVTDREGNAVTNEITVGAIDSVDCLPAFYTGITPNADNFNDYWHIDNAEFFIEKSVEIFNRYGGLVWNTDSYDNLNSPFTGIHQNGELLPDGTYFYIAKFDNSTYRGWIEVSR